MNAKLAMFLDSGTEWWPIASAALAAVVAGIVLAVFKRHWSHQDKLEEAAQGEVASGIDNLNRRLEEEANLRRSKDDSLGDDIQDTRGALDHLCGTLGKDRPAYRSKK